LTRCPADASYWHILGLDALDRLMSVAGLWGSTGVSAIHTVTMSDAKMVAIAKFNKRR